MVLKQECSAPMQLREQSSMALYRRASTYPSYRGSSYPIYRTRFKGTMSLDFGGRPRTMSRRCERRMMRKIAHVVREVRAAETAQGQQVPIVIVDRRR